MKIMLVLIVFLFGGCAANVAAYAELETLNQQYKIIKIRVFETCSYEAKFADMVADQRDAGVPEAAVVNWYIEYAESINKQTDEKIEHIKTREALLQILLITFIFDYDHMSPKELYVHSRDSCTHELYPLVDSTFEYKRNEILNH